MSVDDDCSEVLYIDVYRVKQEELFFFTKLRGIVENSRNVHQEQSEYAPKVLHITEEDKQRRENESHSKIEYNKANNRDDQGEESKVEGDAVDYAENEEYYKRYAEVYK